MTRHLGPGLGLAALVLIVPACIHNSSGGSSKASTAPSPTPTPQPSPTPSTTTPALVTLGQALFHDKVLSGNKNIACNTCHNVSTSSGDALPVSFGEGGSGVGTTRTQGTGLMIGRNSLALFNNSVTPASPVFVSGPLGAPVLTSQPTLSAQIATFNSAPNTMTASPTAGAAAPALPPSIAAFDATFAAVANNSGGTSASPGQTSVVSNGGAITANPAANPALSPTAIAADVGGGDYGGVTESFFWDSRVQFNPFLSPEPLLDSSATPLLAAIHDTVDSPLALQALFPVTVPEEMRGQPGTNELASATTNEQVWALLMARLVGTQNGSQGGIAGYRTLFQAAYPSITNFDDLNFGHATRAIAAYVAQTFSATDTPFDDFVAGNQNALTVSQQNGMNLFFGQANCSACHSGVHFSDFDHHALAVPQVGPGKAATGATSNGDDIGFALVSLDPADNYKFRTPTLRNVTLTGPYMHDGCYSTLEQVVNHHMNPAAALQAFDPTTLPAAFQSTYDSNATHQAARIAAIDPLLLGQTPLTTSQVSDIVAFMGSLTDPQSMSRVQAGRPSSVPSGLTID